MVLGLGGWGLELGHDAVFVATRQVVLQWHLVLAFSLGWEWGELKSRVREFFGLCTGRRRCGRGASQSSLPPSRVVRQHREGKGSTRGVFACPPAAALVGRPPVLLHSLCSAILCKQFMGPALCWPMGM